MTCLDERINLNVLEVQEEDNNCVWKQVSDHLEAIN